MFSVRVERTGDDGKIRHELYGARECKAELDADGGVVLVTLHDEGGQIVKLNLEGVAVAYVMNSLGNTVWKIQTSAWARQRADVRPSSSYAGARR